MKILPVLLVVCSIAVGQGKPPDEPKANPALRELYTKLLLEAGKKEQLPGERSMVDDLYLLPLAHAHLLEEGIRKQMPQLEDREVWRLAHGLVDDGVDFSLFYELFRDRIRHVELRFFPGQKYLELDFVLKDGSSMEANYYVDEAKAKEWIATLTEAAKVEAARLALDSGKGFVEEPAGEVTINKVVDLGRFEKMTSKKKIRPYQFHHYGPQFPLGISAQVHD